MAAPATYIRTIHSSLTSASAHHSHHSPSAWASTAQYHLNHGHHNLHTLGSNPLSNGPLVSGGQPLPYPNNQVSHGAQGLMHTPSISTHNAHMYTHHLRDLTHPASSPSPHRPSGAQGPMVMHIPPSPDAVVSVPQQGPRRSLPSPPPHSRRRSASIRMPPSYRFDPFGDVDDSLGASAGFSSSGGGGLSSSMSATAPPFHPARETSPAESEAAAMDQEDDIASGFHSNQPYTIHIPPAAPLEIQQYTPQLPRTPSPAARTLSHRASSFTPSTPVPKLPSSASALGLTYAPTGPTNNSFPAPNLSKIVAGIMLNRVHGAKPIRRRVVGENAGRQYVKSCLSSVVSVEV